MVNPKSATEIEKQWDDLTEDLIQHAGGATAQNIQKMTATLDKLSQLIKSAPASSVGNIQKMSNVMQQQLRAIQDLSTSKVKEDKERVKEMTASLQAMLEQASTKYEQQLSEATDRVFASTSFGQSLAKANLKARQKEQKDFRRADHSERKEILKQQFKEIAQLQARAVSQDQARALSELRRDIAMQMVNINKGNLTAFKALEKRLGDLDSYGGGLSSTQLSSRLEAISEAAAAKIARRQQIFGKVGSFAMNELDQWGLGGLSRMGVGAFKGLKWAKNNLPSFGGRVSQSGGLRSGLMNAIPGVGTVGSGIGAANDAMADRNTDELLRRQVGALEKLAVSNKELARKSGQSSSGILSSLSGMKGLASSIIGGLSNLLGLRKIVSAIAGALGLGGGGAAAAGGGLLKRGLALAGKVGRGLGLGLLGTGVDWLAGKGADYADSSGADSNVGKGLRTLGTAAKYAGIGAGIGSFVPGVGTVIGAGIGGVIGTGKGIYDNWFSGGSKPSGAAAATAPAGAAGSPGSASSGALYNLKSGADMSGLQPGVKSNFDAMVAEYKSMGGKSPVNVNSAYRSTESQARLYAKDPSNAAPPGKSSHEKGLAIDIDRAAANEMDKMGLLTKYGFSRPVKNEPWHLQAAGTAGSLAAQGVYSADSPKDQGAAGAPSSASASPNATPVAAAPSGRSPSTSDAAAAMAAGGAREPSATMGPANQASVASIPTLSCMDQGFYLMNAGCLTG